MSVLGFRNIMYHASMNRLHDARYTFLQFERALVLGDGKMPIKAKIHCYGSLDDQVT